jgi:hypothetical protein
MSTNAALRPGIIFRIFPIMMSPTVKWLFVFWWCSSTSNPPSIRAISTPFSLALMINSLSTLTIILEQEQPAQKGQSGDRAIAGDKDVLPARGRRWYAKRRAQKPNGSLSNVLIASCVNGAANGPKITQNNCNQALYAGVERANNEALIHF